jgi:hypothetical protein
MRHGLRDRPGRPHGHRLKLAILAAGELFDNSAGQDAFALAHLADVIAEPLPQFRRQLVSLQAGIG